MKLLRIFLCLVLFVVPIYAQEQRCDRQVSVTIAAAASGTVATAVPGQTIYICGFMLTGNTAATGIQFQSGSTNLTGVMLTPANGPLVLPVAGYALWGNDGAAVTIAVTTGAATGFVSFAQR